MAVERLHTQLIGIVHPLYSRDVIRTTQVDFGCPFRCYIKEMQGNHRISLPCFWIFKSFLGWIQILSIYIHRKFGYLSLVEAQKGDFGTIGIPCESPYKSEFLLIDPIR